MQLIDSTYLRYGTTLHWYYRKLVCVGGRSQIRYCSLPTMHRFQWDILYRWSCGLLVTNQPDMTSHN